MQRIEKLERNLEAVRHIGQVLSKTLDVDELLYLIIGEMTKLMSAERSSLFIVDKQQNEIWSKIAEKSEIREIRVSIGTGVSGWVAQHGELLNIPDATLDDRFDSSIDKKTGYHTKSLLTAPILKPSANGSKGTEQVIAVVQVLNKKDGSCFDHDDETLIELLASQISISLTNAFLYSKLNSKVKELDFLYDIEKKVNESNDFSRLLNDLIDRLVYYINAEAGSILLLDKDQANLYFRVATGKHKNYLKTLKLRPDHGLVGWTIAHKTPLLANDVKNDPRFDELIAKETSLFPESIICVPLISKGETLGAVELLNKRTDSKRFSKDDLQVLELISGQITRIIETITTREKMVEEDRFVSIGNMASMIVHDLRAPMGNIQGFVDLMRDEDVSQDERQEYAEIVINQIRNLISMTNEILDFAKGKTTILARKMSVTDLYNNYITLVEKDLKRRNIEFRHENTAGHTLIYGDLNKLVRVLLNLQKNANESNTRPDKKLTFRIDKLENAVCISLKDNGPGIPSEIKEQLFESFVTSGKEQGTGLGLAIVKRIVDDHKGQITVETSNKGTTFKICIPEFID
jgi:signal transduction histidine kinase